MSLWKELGKVGKVALKVVGAAAHPLGALEKALGNPLGNPLATLEKYTSGGLLNKALSAASGGKIDSPLDLADKALGSPLEKSEKLKKLKTF